MWIKVEWEPTWKAIQISEVFKFLTGSDTSILGTGGGWGATYRPLNLINRGRGQGGGCLESRSGRGIGLFEFQKCPRKKWWKLGREQSKIFLDVNFGIRPWTALKYDCHDGWTEVGSFIQERYISSTYAAFVPFANGSACKKTFLFVAKIYSFL